MLTAFGLAIGGLLPVGAAKAPWHAYLGGPIGVVFVAAGSWVIARIGSGAGWVQEEGGEKRPIRPGDVVWTPGTEPQPLLTAARARALPGQQQRRAMPQATARQETLLLIMRAYNGEENIYRLVIRRVELDSSAQGDKNIGG